MRALDARLWLGALSVLGVLAYVASAFERKSPGPIARVHGRVPELFAADGCKLCHGGWTTSLSEACRDCHATIATQIEDGAGLHGAIAADTALDCALCHSDHHGTSFAMVNARSFRLAGVQERDAFDHALVGFPMEGKHVEIACTECHEHADADTLPAGAQRYGGLRRDCASCHEDPHEGAMQRACADCHAQVDFGALTAFEHDERLPLAGAHADFACRSCHAADGPHALERLVATPAARVRESWRECADCHSSPHDAAFVEGNARLANVSAGASCAACHDAAHATFTGELVRVDAAQHACAGFALDGPHDALACADCHAGAGDSFDFAARYPGRLADDCVACHDDPHGAQFAAGAFGATDCLSCHERHRFEPPAFGVEEHARTALPLRGTHRDAACHACHEQASEHVPRTFVGTAATCEQCHADAHRGFFDALLAARDPVSEGTCASCHLETTFDETPHFDHGAWTGFGLAGAHAAARCEACHPRAAEADAAGRTLGFVADEWGTVDGCASCHENPHGARFDGPRQPAQIDGRAGCARCHDDTSFRSLSRGFDHGVWTGYRIDGAHAALGCSSCHAPLRRPDEEGRTWGRAAGTSCAACHADPHAGQFAVGAATTCERCHEDARSFRKLKFHHDVDSRFPLSEAHAVLACVACHRPWEAEDGQQIVRYRPLSRDCASCHGAQPGGPVKRRPR